MILSMECINGNHHTMSEEDLNHQVHLRRQFAQQCVGSLYPSIMFSQIETILELIRTKKNG